MLDLVIPVRGEFQDPLLRQRRYGNGRSSSECKRGCCWTPFGHSTVRDGLVSSVACHCHEFFVEVG